MVNASQVIESRNAFDTSFTSISSGAAADAANATDAAADGTIADAAEIDNKDG